MSIDSLQAEIENLKKENSVLSRQLARLRATMERNEIVAASMANINAMQAAERQKQENYMRLLLKCSPNIILLLDKNKAVTYCTENVLMLANIADFSTIKGEHFRECLHYFADKPIIDELEAQISFAVKTGSLLKREIPLTMSDGEVHPYSLYFVAQYGSDETFEGTAIVMYDISDVRKMQVAAKQAQQANAAKSTFLSNMSHEIRTPMGAIIGMTAIAQASDDVDKKDYCLGKIKEASDHLLNVINDILDISKIEANKLELSCHNVSPKKVLQKVIDVVNYRVEERKQKLEVHIDKGLPATIETDAQRLTQVLTNLLSNALKFTPEYGTIRLDASLKEELPDRTCTLQFSISDSGIGISAEQQSRLFNPFEQADSSTSRKYGGTGLGLAISKRIVEMMDGQISVQSELGNGSTFTFTIKAQRVGKENIRQMRPDLTFENMRLLIADDSPEVLEYFTHITQSLKLQCDAVTTAAETLEMIEQRGAYDMYFIDRHLPDMDGIELSRRIKRRNDEYSIIILTSALEFQEFENQARLAGVDGFLSKPLFPSTVINCLNYYTGIGEIEKKSQTIGEGFFEGDTILVAEDVKINREIIQAQLAFTKIKIDFAVNGQEAVTMFERNPGLYKMIFMDMQMPELDGIEATKAIRMLNVPQAQEVPIVAMTANVFKEDVNNCLNAGMDDHIGKPLDIKIVIEKMCRYMIRVKDRRDG